MAIISQEHACKLVLCQSEEGGWVLRPDRCYPILNNTLPTFNCRTNYICDSDSAQTGRSISHSEAHPTPPPSCSSHHYLAWCEENHLIAWEMIRHPMATFCNNGTIGSIISIHNWSESHQAWAKGNVGIVVCNIWTQGPHRFQDCILSCFDFFLGLIWREWVSLLFLCIYTM